ncbi:MAG: isoleucine--tRNA ligase [Bdellovibrionales bacterium]
MSEPADYKTTVFLPKTDFPMKAGLAEQEPKWLAYWEQLDLYQRLRQQSKGRDTFILHDGPPYANGNIHLGHAVNKILKDTVVRAYQMLGFDAPYVPGWDCHGLPIEWKIEEKYRAKKLNKDDIDILTFREECRAFAAHWVAEQRNDFKRLGVQGDWENPYTTMTNDAEAIIAGEIHKYLMSGSLYRGVKPVMWSTVEKTALAEAEVEYHDHKSTTAYVAFPVVKASTFDLKDAHIVIWTTTPWTLPANRAIAYGAEIDYVVLTANNKKYVVAEALLGAFLKAAKIESFDKGVVLKGEKLAGTICAHPLRGQGYNFDVPALAGDFVTTETGTGFVHIAPSHGEDDFNLGKQYNLPIPELVTADGRYNSDVPLFADAYIYYQDGKPGPANKAVLKAIGDTGLLLAEETIVHSYPHSWRSKAPVIFRTTPQWFISMDTNDLRQVALKAIKETRWVPAKGEARITAMIEQRPDWCISRQRAWGVPIAIFVNKKTLEPLRDDAVNKKIVDTFKAEGSDAWWKHEPQFFLGSAGKADDFEQIFDIVDVWFESGCTHAFVCEARDDLNSPADLYLEGSDQHRGWFHSSLLESCGTRGRAPFKAVLTHGFALDEKGYKMSKSLGNVIDPQKIVKDYGADILRLWVMMTDYTEDVRLGQDVLKQTAELYRKMRNTLRYILGGLDGFTDAEKLPVDEMPELERYVLHLLATLDANLRAHIAAYDFTSAINAVHHFCTVELSAFYFDIRKDALYCDAVDSTRRRACRTVMDTLYNTLTAWLAPFLCFTTEEAWQLRGRSDAVPSVHMRTFPEISAAWKNDVLAKKWRTIRDAREVVTAAIELKRAEKVIGSSLQAAPQVTVTKEQALALHDIDFAEVCITSDITLTEGAATVVNVAAANGMKCDRCWQVLPEVGSHADHPTLCNRCHSVVTAQKKVAA